MKFLLLACFIPAVAVSQEHARILSQSTTYTIRSNEDVEIVETCRIRINSEKGKQFAVFQEYTDKFRKITAVSLTVIDNSGKRIKRLRRDDGHEFGFNPSYEINDAKVVVIDPEYQNYPYTVEVNSTIKMNGYISLPSWTPRLFFNVAVDQSSLTVLRPIALQLKFKEELITGKTVINQDDMLATSYEVTNLPAVERKFRYKDFYDAQPKVLISPKRFSLSDVEGSLDSWSDFGDWFLSLNSSPYELDPKTIAFIGTIDKNDRVAMIRKLYEFMQDRTRYVSIQLGIGGFKSLPTEDVEKYGYGDCKALTTYMKNMLDFAGVKSNYILVRAGNDVPNVMADFPSNQFNHVYLGVPMVSDTVYLECTSQTSPSNYTGTFTDDRNVLWIAQNKSQIIRSRIYDHTKNVKKSMVSISLNNEGDAQVGLDVTNQGVFFDEIMIYKSAPADYVGNYNQDKFGYSDFAIKNFSYKQPDRNIAEFNSTYSIQVNGLAKAAGTKLILPGVPTTPIKKYIEGDEMMKYFSIKRGMTVTDEIMVSLPQNYWIYSLPEKETISTPFGSYSLSTEFDGSKLVIKRSLVLYKGDYTKKSFEDFKTFYQQMDRLEGRKLVLNSKT